MLVAERIKMKIRKGDTVVVLTGRDKGKSGEVLRVFPDENRALVQGVNVVKRHTKPRPGQTGGIVEKENPIHASNLSLADPKDKKATKVGFKTVDGRKVRFARRSGEIIDR
jgi:large subunit ribosomal protein L24